MRASEAARVVARPVKRVVDELRLPARARAVRARNRGPLGDDPGIEAAVDAAMGWLARAQDRSATPDGGVAWSFSLREGWGASYPETTGYLVATFLDEAERTGSEATRERARRMLDWLVSIQFPDGGFQGSTIGAQPLVPVTFNTGQILIGLAAGVRALGDAYRPSMRRAADWLVGSMDPDGCWRKHPTPFAAPGEKAYETHVAWGLLEAARVDPDRGYAEAALRNIRWALERKQQPNGWFADCSLSDPARPLTHTIGYALRGVVEGHRLSGDACLLAAARRTADGVLRALRPDGWLAGRLARDWREASDAVCPTGSAQIAHCWLLLFERTGDERYRDAALAVNGFLRRTLALADDVPDIRGALQGSFPIDGDYLPWAYPNWAAKFFVDANRLEQRLR